MPELRFAIEATFGFARPLRPASPPPLGVVAFWVPGSLSGGCLALLLDAGYACLRPFPPFSSLHLNYVPLLPLATHFLNGWRLFLVSKERFPLCLYMR